MTNFRYCPTCWPTDLGEIDLDHRCLDCGTPTLVATPEKQVELLLEQNEGLAICLEQAMDVLKAHGIMQSHPPRPGLRLVHSARRDNDTGGDS